MRYQIVIPARGGSKRFPGKNLATLNGIPLIAHSILFALQNKLGADVYVNTDDSQISRIAKEYGAKVTQRPPELALDTTPTVDVMKQQIKYFEENQIYCDAIILIQVTNPIRPEGLIELAVKAFEESGRKSLTCFSQLNKKFGTIHNNVFEPENYTPGQRMQDLVPRYFENGQIYITDNNSIKVGKIITEDSFPFISNEIGAEVDIDEPNDMVFAEFIIGQKTKR